MVSECLPWSQPWFLHLCSGSGECGLNSFPGITRGSLPSLGDEPLPLGRLRCPAAVTGNFGCFLEQGCPCQCSWQWALLGKWKWLVPRVVTFPNSLLPTPVCQEFHLCAPARTWDVCLRLLHTKENLKHSVLEQYLSCTNHVETGHRTKPALALEAVS